MALYTFGYEGLTIDRFILRLKKAGVRAVFDVRQLPLSRKKGFSKTAFAAALHDASILYAHMPVFGCPKPIRDQYKIDQNWPRYEKAFNAYLETQHQAVIELGKLAGKTSAVLVCFEANYHFCHRSLVAKAAALAGGPQVVHLTATGEIVDLQSRAAA